jgi:hypothetical protein
MNIFSSYTDVINSVVEINNKDLIMTNIEGLTLPISNKYFMYLYFMEPEENFNKFMKFIADDSRTLEFPFEKSANNTNNNFYPEEEQFMQIDLNNEILNIFNLLNEFKNIIEKSNANKILVIDVEHLIKFMSLSRSLIIQNNIIEILLFQLKKIKFDYILIVDTKQIVNYNNLLYVQLELCLTDIDGNIEEIKTLHNLNKNINVMKNIMDPEYNIYWSVLETNDYLKINEIESPLISGEFYDIIQIDDKIYYKYTLTLLDTIQKNLIEMQLNYDSGILIEPIDRIKIIV